MGKYETRYCIEGIFRDISANAYKVEVKGKATYDLEGTWSESEGWADYRIMNAIQSLISIRGYWVFEDNDIAKQYRKNFFEVVEPAAVFKQYWFSFVDMDLGIESVRLTACDPYKGEERPDKNGWFADKNKQFEEMYPQKSLDDDQEIEA